MTAALVRVARRLARRVALPVGVVLIGSGLGVDSLDGQSADELELLARATAHEVRGDYEEARTLLEQGLDARPTWSAALFSLERVLRSAGQLRDVLPFARRHLERDPGSAGARYLVLRVLSEVDSLEALEPAVLDWVAAEPASAEPYREGARILREHFGPDRALALLRRGMEAVDEPLPLALEAGDVLLETGDLEGAAAVWAAAVGPGGSGASPLRRRIERLPVEAEKVEVAASVVDVLVREETTPGRLRAAVGVGVAAGLDERVVEVAARLLPEMERRSRRGFLAELARDAEEADLPVVALWAWSGMRELAVGERERRALDERIARAALAAGDTAAAVATRRRLASSLEPASGDRRRALAELVRIEARGGDSEAAVELLGRFRSEYPDAPELAELAPAVAAALAADGLDAEATRVLEGVEGPRAALERAYLLLESGDLEGGRSALLAAADGLEPGVATAVIQLVTLLDRLSPAGAEAVARSAALAHRGRPGEATGVLERASISAPEGEAPALLAQAARLAHRSGRPGEAARMRERLVAEHPDSPEAGEATLELARWLARDGGRVDEAARLLEELIVSRPTSPVVPAARRELERLGGRGSGGSAGGAP